MRDYTPDNSDYNPAVDLDISRWREYEDIITDSLWLLGARDRTGTHSAEYWGNFVPQIPNQIIRRFTRRGEIVLDPFCGLGTTLIEATALGRHSIGIDLNPEIARRAQTLAQETRTAYDVSSTVLVGDSTNTYIIGRVRESLEQFSREYVDCAILHPPYHNIIRFSEDTADLSNLSTIDEFLEGFRSAVCNTRDLLHPLRRMALVIGDIYARSEWVPLGFECMQVCRDEGFRLKAINVKDIQGNERGKGKNSNVWRYRALKQGLYIFKHEYVMIFQKIG